MDFSRSFETTTRKKYVGVELVPVLLAICLLAMLTLIITACARGNASTGSGNQNAVHMNASNFEQSSITIKKGEKLTLINDDPINVHIIENGTWDKNGTQRPYTEPGAPKVDASMNGGDTQTFGPFTTAGTFQLYCTVHSDMNLTVIVK